MASSNTREDFDPPIVLGGGMFAQDDDSDDDDLLSAQEVEEEARLGQQKSFLFADLVCYTGLFLIFFPFCSILAHYQINQLLTINENLFIHRLTLGQNLEVRELGYSATNAAYVWPNGGRLAALLSSGPPQPSPLLLELGSGTGWEPFLHT